MDPAAETLPGPHQLLPAGPAAGFSFYEIMNTMNDFWQQLPSPFFVLAPMEAVTDVVFRHVIAEAASPDVWFSEFTNATGWVHAGEKAIGGRLIKTDDENPIVAQIWGGEPGDMEQLAAHCRELGYDGIDINMGCPAKSAVKSGGSALIRQPQLAADSIAAAKTAGLPVSVKTRLGYSSVNEWHDWLAHLLRQDIVNMTIHLRSKKEMSKVPAHHELIPEIVKLRDEIAPHTQLTINGDIENRQHAEQIVRQNPGVNGVMIGRGVFQNPYCFARKVSYGAERAGVDERQSDEHSAFPAEVGQETTVISDQPYARRILDVNDGEAVSVSGLLSRKSQLLALLRLHLDLYDQWSEQTGRPYETLKRFFKIYVRDFDGASALRAALMLTTSTTAARQLLDNHEQSVANTEVDAYTEPMSDTIKAIVFDSDGTLLDTRELIFEGFKAVLSSNGLEHLATDQYIRQRLGKPTVETFEQLIAGHNVDVSARELANQLDETQEKILDKIRAYPHTRELLDQWKDRGVKLCLFTSGYNFMVDRNFAAAGIPDVRELFDAIMTADDHTARKPEPDAILELLRRVEVDPADAVVVGDHAYDIIAAKRARAGLAIGILHGVGTQHELSTAGADFLTTDLQSLNHLMSFAKR